MLPTWLPTHELTSKALIAVLNADTGQGHIGYVYQSANFLYTGLSANRVDWTIKGQEHKHSKTISDGMSLEDMKSKYGEDFYYVERTRKHRYIYFVANKKDKKLLKSKLNYPNRTVPKGRSPSDTILAVLWLNRSCCSHDL
jgi:hypothetical protein